MSLHHSKILQFQEKLHDLHIHAGLGVTENNIDKVQLLVEQLNDITIELYYQVHERPVEKPEFTESLKAEVEHKQNLQDLGKIKGHKPEKK